MTPRHNIGTVPVELTTLPFPPPERFLVPIAMTETHSGHVGVGATEGQLLFQISGPQPMLIAVSLDDLARAVAARAQEAANYAWVMRP